MQGDCLERMKELADNSVDAIVTDPPYGFSFMGKKWDYEVPSAEVWAECLRILKPGGHLLSFGGSRTYHRLACNIEDAGFEIRDQCIWMYGSGFPKSANISKAIDKAAGVEREKGEVRTDGRGRSPQKIDNHGAGDTGVGHADGSKQIYTETVATSDDAKTWDGWAAHEPICLARKPFKGTVANNVLEHGTGALNIDGCRVGTDDKLGGGRGNGSCKATDDNWNRPYMEDEDYLKNMAALSKERTALAEELGRFPANLLHDGSEEVLSVFPDSKGQQGDLKNHSSVRKSPNGCFGEMAPANDHKARVETTTSAARFFYCAKTSKADRNEGLDHFEDKQVSQEYGFKTSVDGREGRSQSERTNSIYANTHPTVKPTSLMAYLCRLITPPGGVVLDPFMGSGSTGKAAVQEGFRFIGIEQDADYMRIAEARIKHASVESLI
jgi:site-specific DNA-methyltransferase (adenine-specific)